MKTTICYLVFILTLSGCISTPSSVTIPVNVYDIEAGEKLIGEFLWDGSGRGAATLRLSNDALCEGEYLTSVGGTTTSSKTSSWGKVYSYGSGVTRSLSSANQNIVSRPNTQQGTAILICSNKEVLDCEYLVSLPTNNGSGYCVDKKENKYRIVF